MARQTDSKQRAAEFLRQWQEQVTRSLSDPDAIRTMMAAMQSFTGTTHDASPIRPAAATDAGDDAIGDLARRLAKLERAVAKLTASVLSVDAKAKNPAGTGNRRRAKPVAKRAGAVATHKRRVVKKRQPAKPKAKRKR